MEMQAVQSHPVLEEFRVNSSLGQALTYDVEEVVSFDRRKDS